MNQNSTEATNVDLKSAEAAFKSFFNNEKQAPTPTMVGANPVEQVMNRIKEQETPPNQKTVTKINVGKDNAVPDSMSVDEAQSILDTERSFKEILKEMKVSFSDLFSIIDSMLMHGYYEEKFSIKGLEFAFRTKKLQSVDHINDMLDGSKYVMPNVAGHFLLEHSMAASLVYFKLGKGTPRVFNHDTHEDDDTALKFIRKELSAPLYSIMANKFNRFELLAGLASRDEAIEHFLEHTQD